MNAFDRRTEIRRACQACHATADRILRAAETAEGAAFAAIINVRAMGNTCYHAIRAAQDVWRSFQAEYDSMVSNLSTIAGVEFVSYSTVIPGTRADKLCTTLYDFGIHLGQINAGLNNVQSLLNSCTSATGEAYGDAIGKIATGIREEIVWRLGFHWPAIIGSRWPNLAACVAHVDCVTVDGTDYRQIFFKSDNGDAGVEIERWYDHSQGNPAPNGTWTDIPADLSVGDILRAQNVSFKKDTDGNPSFWSELVDGIRVWRKDGADHRYEYEYAIKQNLPVAQIVDGKKIRIQGNGGIDPAWSAFEVPAAKPLEQGICGPIMLRRVKLA